MIRLYKFQVVAIVQEVDEDGNVTAERPITGEDGKPLEAFGRLGLNLLVNRLESQLKRVNEEEAMLPTLDAVPS